MIEIARSYTRKLNLGNYESLDIFCSRKEECEPKEAKKVSKRLFEFCRQEVEQEIDSIRGNQMEKKTFLNNTSGQKKLVLDADGQVVEEVIDEKKGKEFRNI